MKRFLTTLVILTGLLGSGGAVWADAESDNAKGDAARKAENLKEAFKWYRKAAEKGDKEGQTWLCMLYYEGWGVLQDMISAHMWCNIASANGQERTGELRDVAAKELSSVEIAKARRMAKRCMDSNYKDCGASAKAKSWWQKLKD